MTAKIMTLLGTRPEGIKMAPVVKEIERTDNLISVFVNTAQHREMLDQVLDLFQLVPEYDLNVMRPKQRLEELTMRLFQGITPILEKEKPDMVLVHGDTTTTFVGAYAAFLQQIPVGHIESGLRTNHMYSPFPEELNRQLVGRLATYHFAVTEANKKNLLKENVAEKNIAVVGNTVIDALLEITSRHYQFEGELASIIHSTKKTILMTTHRRENIDELKHVYRAIQRVVKQHEDVQVVFPVHKNPLIRQKVMREFANMKQIHLIEPLDYEEFLHVLKHCYMVITDSGGIQEEAPALGKPVLVARDTTERPEGIEAGTLKVVGTSEEKIVALCEQLLRDEAAYNEMANAPNPFGDGYSAKQIVHTIQSLLEETRVIYQRKTDEVIYR
ncbi:UDP-N-acetylglucosamine 2-epimerase (non-hydrolyzing) [Salibacterium salarium]|uniref:non-hydrolyzing UDP-N-acetylglucosamine 2-epimerase n=1 Tax=Salibacterium salarium TaxID=284579 RepID=UPI002787AFAA|nr:UDP-N-acetylglucosamine 2-epimerase (non-hydrolyzing) [Salibacterium salarium]MDQ0298246.1 UDP-N-acetylglucosamine 2-epimerase (non-hydrolyzing) [Salibacterium salarium]